MRPLFLIISLVLLGCAENRNTTEIAIGILPSNVTALQKKIIGQLSGNETIDVSGGTKISLASRWDKRERGVTRMYLEALCKQLDVPSQRHSYVMPNSTWAVDFLLEPLRGTNIYATLPATVQSNKYVVIGAHYDTDGKNFPGAIDNGSGVALIAGVLSQLRKITRRNKHVIVVFFDQEEENISAGSLAFANFLKRSSFDIHSVHTFDLIGWDSDKNREVQLELPVTNDLIEDLYKNHAKILDIPTYSTRSNGSDYSSFYKEGINTIGISQAYAKGDISGKKDSPEDKFELVDFEYLASSTRLAFEVLKDLLDD